jgi:hypothetical protein
MLLCQAILLILLAAAFGAFKQSANARRRNPQMLERPLALLAPNEYVFFFINLRERARQFYEDRKTGNRAKYQIL